MLWQPEFSDGDFLERPPFLAQLHNDGEQISVAVLKRSPVDFRCFLAGSCQAVQTLILAAVPMPWSG